MHFIRLLLYPFSLIYYLIISVRNFLYDTNIFKSVSFSLPVIGVGNLTVGGTGKTPTIEYIVRLLKSNYALVTMSRGYGRKTKGLVIAGPSSSAMEIGDEPMQFLKKFGNDITVTVAEERAYSIPYVLYEKPDSEVILLDDAFQHRSIRPGFNILLTDYTRLFYKDWLLPTGNLREPSMCAQRANLIIVTKCPEKLPVDEQNKISKRIYAYSKENVPVYFSYIDYSNPVSFFGNEDKPFSRKIILVTAIANSKPLLQHLTENHDILKHIAFPDHHYFTPRDIEKIIRVYQATDRGEVCILFTEKDAMRLYHTEFEKQLSEFPVFYQPITFKFVHSGAEFDKLILNVVSKLTSEKEG